MYAHVIPKPDSSQQFLVSFNYNFLLFVFPKKGKKATRRCSLCPCPYGMLIFKRDSNSWRVLRKPK